MSVSSLCRSFRLTPLAAAAFALALGACTTVRVDIPEANVNVPKQFHYRAGFGGSPVAAPAAASAASGVAAAPVVAPQASGESLQRWWLSFNDPVLTDLIERGLKANTDIRVALDRVREARAYHTQAESAMYPNVDAGAGVLRQKYDPNSTDSGNSSSVSLPFPLPVPLPSFPSTTPSVPNSSRGYGAGFGVAWEVDIFGARRSKADSVDELIRGAHEQAHGAQLLVAGDIATNYFEARGVEQRMEVLSRGLAVTRRLVAYANARFTSGQARRADLLRAQAEAEYNESQWAALRMLLQHRLHRLATLTGQTTDKLRALPPVPAGAGIPATLPSVLPSDVLENRPDVRGAAFVLRSRAAELGEARAELFPKFYLGFLAEDGHVRSSGLTNSGGILQAIGLGVRLPIFNAGRLRAQIAVQDARLDAAAAEYERAILQALEDVESAYVARLALDNRTARLDRAVSYSLEAARQTEKLFQAGAELLQTALEAHGKALQREDELVQSRTARATTTVLLYKAIGAGWSEDGTNAALAALDGHPQEAKPQENKAVPVAQAASAAQADAPPTQATPTAQATQATPAAAPVAQAAPAAAPAAQATHVAKARPAPKHAPQPVAQAASQPAPQKTTQQAAARPAASPATPAKTAAAPEPVVVRATRNGPMIVPATPPAPPPVAPAAADIDAAGLRARRAPALPVAAPKPDLSPVPLTAAPALPPQRTELDPPEPVTP